MTTNDVSELFTKLQYAKDAVLATVNNDNVSVDFHDLVYWAQEVERLREEIKKLM